MRLPPLRHLHIVVRAAWVRLDDHDRLLPRRGRQPRAREAFPAATSPRALHRPPGDRDRRPSVIPIAVEFLRARSRGRRGGGAREPASRWNRRGEFFPAHFAAVECGARRGRPGRSPVLPTARDGSAFGEVNAEICSPDRARGWVSCEHLGRLSAPARRFARSPRRLDQLPVRHAGRDYRLVQGDSIALLERLATALGRPDLRRPAVQPLHGGSLQLGPARLRRQGGWTSSRGVDTDTSSTRLAGRLPPRAQPPAPCGERHPARDLLPRLRDAGPRYHLLIRSPGSSQRQPEPRLPLLHALDRDPHLGRPSREEARAHLRYRSMRAGTAASRCGTSGRSPTTRGRRVVAPHARKSESARAATPRRSRWRCSERVIAAASNPGDLVVDPFNGSAPPARRRDARPPLHRFRSRREVPRPHRAPHRHRTRERPVAGARRRATPAA